MFGGWQIVVGAAVAVGLLVGSYFKGYANGSASRNSEIVALQTSIEGSRLAALAAEKRAEEAAQKVRIEYRTKVETVIQEREAARELIEVVRRDASCDLPPSFRVLHDTAAGYPADKTAPGTVSAAQAAETVADNYATARENAARLEALQNYIAQIQDAPPSPDYRP